MLGGEVLEGVDTDVQMQAADSQDSQEMAMRTADKLLKELRPKPGEKTHQSQSIISFWSNSDLNQVKKQPDLYVL